MSSLARIRHIPTPEHEPGSVEADIARLRFVCGAMAERDELIRSLRERGLSVKQLTEITGLGHQRVYQVLQGTNGHQSRAVEDRNGSRSASR